MFKFSATYLKNCVSEIQLHVPKIAQKPKKSLFFKQKYDLKENQAS